MEHFLGIDIGGTNVKFGTVSPSGEIIKKKKFPTPSLNEDGEFVKNFAKLVKKRLKKAEVPISKVGIGVPGTLSNDRSTILDTPNIPALQGQKLKAALEAEMPEISFFLENDANAAALGEFHFGSVDLPPTFMFVTLGTGVGGGAVIDKKVFKGGDGNGMEIGHIISSNGKTIEENIGKKGIISLAQQKLSNGFAESSLRNLDTFDAKMIAQEALAGDPLAISIYKEFGMYLGELLVSCTRILDIKTVLVGGGVSEVFHYMEDSMYEVTNKFLPPYYTEPMRVELATLGNNAGIIGAAALCFD